MLVHSDSLHPFQVLTVQTAKENQWGPQQQDKKWLEPSSRRGVNTEKECSREWEESFQKGERSLSMKKKKQIGVKEISQDLN